MAGNVPSVAINPSEILQKLIRFNTTNPPGNETECIRFIYSLLVEAGLDPIMVGKVPERENLVVKIPGAGDAPPLLLYGHADVVTAENQKWRYPPFEGVIEEGFIWGRGALDMKGALVMMLAALLRSLSEGTNRPSNLLFAVVCDEENGGVYGAKYLTEEHPQLFQGIDYAISEMGGFTMPLAGKRFYPIMISEKQRCSYRVTITGQGGHGSFPARGGSMAKLGKILNNIDRKRMPVHITPPVKMTLESLAQKLPFPANLVFYLLGKPSLTDRVLNLLGDKGKFFDPLLHNTLSATIVRGGDMINVIPNEVHLDLDGRMLPGFAPTEMTAEVQALLGAEAELEVTYYSPGPQELKMGLFERLAAILVEGDPEAVPIPFVGIGVSDARFFSRLGIQTYGYTPMILPEDVDFSRLIHGADERIPLAALDFGIEAIYKLITGK